MTLPTYLYWQLNSTTDGIGTQVEGLHLRVDRAAGSRSASGATPVEYARARSVFVGNLHFDTHVRVVNTRNGGNLPGAHLRSTSSACYLHFVGMMHLAAL